MIQGPTASGKTALGIMLAKELNTVVVSADSRQFYKEMSIGTAKPDLEEQAGVKHYFIDSHRLDNALSAARYEKEALLVLEKLFEEHQQVVLVGGSGLYIDALCNGLDDIPSSIKLRNELNEQVEKEGLSPLLKELQEKDPVYFAEVDQQNPMRVIRAIEVIRLSKKKYSELRKSKPAERNFESIRFVIDLPREQLYERINERVDRMMQAGLLAEVKTLLPYKSNTALRTVGYSELFAYLEGTCELQEAVDLIKQNTRRYAKRQLTWFRRDETSFWLKEQDTEGQKNEIQRRLRKH